MILDLEALVASRTARVPHGSAKGAGGMSEQSKPGPRYYLGRRVIDLGNDEWLSVESAAASADRALAIEAHAKAAVQACRDIPAAALESGALAAALQALSDAESPPGTLSRRLIRIRARVALRALGKLP